MRFCLLFSFAWLLCACATYTAPVQLSEPQQALIDSPYDQTWTNAVAFFANNGIPIKTLEKDSGLIASEYALAANYEDLDCGSAGSLVIIAPDRITLNVLLKPVGSGQTDVRVNVFGSGRMSGIDGSSPSPTRCESTGYLEQRILGYLRGAAGL